MGEVVFLLRRKLGSKQPKVALLALHLIGSLVNNCGRQFHMAINNEKFTRDMANVARYYSNRIGAENKDVSDVSLEMIQNWGEAFISRRQQYPLIVELYFTLRKEGLPFQTQQFDLTRTPILFDDAGTNNSANNLELDAQLAAQLQASFGGENVNNTTTNNNYNQNDRYSNNHNNNNSTQQQRSRGSSSASMGDAFASVAGIGEVFRRFSSNSSSGTTTTTATSSNNNNNNAGSRRSSFSSSSAPSMPVTATNVVPNTTTTNVAAATKELSQSLNVSISILKDMILACSSERELREDSSGMAVDILEQMKSSQMKMNALIERADPEVNSSCSRSTD